MTVELRPLCEIDIVLADPIFVGDGPAGTRLIIEVKESRVSGDRLKGQGKGNAGADWVTIVGGIGSLDVRATFETDDGAVIYCQYRGRADFSNGPGAAPLYVAPTFETADERYTWLNTVQAVGKGTLEGSNLHYEWFEVV